MTGTSSTMRAVVITKFGGPEVLQLVERPLPVPVRGEVRVRVHATAINRADLLQRMGHYLAPADAPADIPGLEFAGVVDAVGDGVTRLAVGDRVCGLAGGGAYAEAIVAPERACAKLPGSMSFEDAAAIPEAFITAHDAMISQAALRGGEAMLVHAVGSGVGTAAVQLGRALGALVVGTARTADKLERARSLGLDHAIVAKDGKFADAVNAAVPGGVQVVIDLVGGAYVDENLRCLDTLGRIVVVGLLAGTRTELDLQRLMRVRATMMGTMLRSRPLEQKLAAVRAFEAQVMPLFARGKLRAIVDTVMPLADAAAAHVRMASNDGFGKIVLTC